MSNVFTSSIGKKLIMSISGAFLLIFLLIHMVANLTILLGFDKFNAVCDFMGTNPAVQVMVPVLAFGVLIHMLYGVIISIQNLGKRGAQGYAVVNRPAASWASKNMLVLGIIILLGLGLHLMNFWTKMQLQEFMGGHSAEGAALVSALFQNPLYCLIYIVWFAALWFHLSHGFWSAFQTVGWNNTTWFKRLKCVGQIYATLICLGFVAVPLFFQVIKFIG